MRSRVLTLAIVGWLLLTSASARGAESESLARHMPSGAVAYAELTEAAAVLERWRESAELAAILEHPLYAEYSQSPQYKKALAGRQILENQLGRDLWTLAREVLGGQVAAGLYPRLDGQQPNVLVLIRVRDEAALAEITERLVPFATLSNPQIRTVETTDGTTMLDLNDKAVLARRGPWLVLASTRGLVEQCLERVDGTGGLSLADDEPFRAMMAQVGTGQLLRLYLNNRMIAEAKGGRLVPEKADNALASLLFGGIAELVAQSPFTAITLDLRERTVDLTATIAGTPQQLPPQFQPFFAENELGASALPSVPGLIGGWSWYRDLAGWYQQRENLVQADQLPGFDQFEAGIGNLLPGKDFGTDVLPVFGKRLTFVAAPQSFDHLDGTPGVKLPAFGLIVELAQPQEGGDLLQLLFQTITSVTNFTAAQQGRQPWVMASETYAGEQIAFARYLEKPKGDRLPIVTNFTPASARIGDRFLLCTSVELCRQLIDQLQRPGEASPRSGGNELLELFPPELAELLNANRDLFLARRVQAGRTLPQAEQELAALEGVLRKVTHLRLSTRTQPDVFQVQFVGEWK